MTLGDSKNFLRHGASRGLFATAELLVKLTIMIDRHNHFGLCTKRLPLMYCRTHYDEPAAEYQLIIFCWIPDHVSLDAD